MNKRKNLNEHIQHIFAYSSILDILIYSPLIKCKTKECNKKNYKEIKEQCENELHYESYRANGFQEILNVLNRTIETMETKYKQCYKAFSQ